MAKYTPLMSDKEIAIRKVWQEKVYQKLVKIKQEKEVTVLGKKFTILPGVFAPLWGDSILLARVIKSTIKENKTVLDLGTGCGIQGIFAAKNGAKVLSVDINPKAIKCAKINAKALGVLQKMRFTKSNIFSNIRGRFDYVIFNPPFRWFKPRDLLERGELDEDYITLRRFFKSVDKHLTKRGRILIVFSESGDLKYLRQLIDESGFRITKHKTYAPENWRYHLFELSSD